MSTQSTKERAAVALFLVLMLALGLLGGFWLAWLTDEPPAPSHSALTVVHGPDAGSAASDRGHAPFAVSGSVAGLVPGQSAVLSVRVSNPDSVPYRIIQLSATARDASPGCAADNLAIKAYSATTPGAPPYVVPARSALTVPLGVTLRSTGRSQDACKHVHFALAFSGTAVLSRRGDHS